MISIRTVTVIYGSSVSSSGANCEWLVTKHKGPWEGKRRRSDVSSVFSFPPRLAHKSSFWARSATVSAKRDRTSAERERASEREARASESSCRVLPHQTRKPSERLWESLLPSFLCANERNTSWYKKGSSYLLSSFCKHNKKLSRGSLLPGLAALI